MTRFCFVVLKSLGRQCITCEHFDDLCLPDYETMKTFRCVGEVKDLVKNLKVLNMWKEGEN